MEQTAQSVSKRTGVLGVVATVLNTGGRALVKTYDIASDVAGVGARVIGKAAGAAVSVPGKVLGGAKGAFSGGVRKVFRSEKDELRQKVAEYEDKIKKLYYEIGKEGSTTEKLESEKVTELIGKVREYEQEIQRLHARITEMSEADAQRKEEAKKEKSKPAKKKVSDEQVYGLVSVAIEKALKQGDFESDSQKEIFKKIANDLLDEEMEVRILAAAELGKMGLKVTADILLEAVKFDNFYLTAEIINSLTNIGDPRTLTLCKEMAKSPNHRVRISSLRGLYKMGSDDEIAPYLIDALNDDHPEVRRTAVTFLGWKDIADSVPGLIQTLQDKDETVRKAAVTALANIKDASAVLPLMRSLTDDSMDIRQKALDALKTITGEDMAVDISLKGKELNNSVKELKEWWQNERLSKIDELHADIQPSAPISEPVEVAPSETAQYESAQEPMPEPVQEAYSIETSPEETVAVAETASTDANAQETLIEAQPAPYEETALASEEPTAYAEPSAQPSEEAQAVEEERYTEEELKRKLKSELIALCREKGIECDETFTKAEIIEQIIKRQ